MSRNAVGSWEFIVHKSFRCNDSSLVDIADVIDDHSVLVSSEAARVLYRTPKHIVEGFGSNEVLLKAAKLELERSKDAQGEDCSDVK
jgi:hypothetical protein